MQFTTHALLAAAALLCSADVQAQRRGDVGLTVTLARHSIRGGLFADRDGGLLDVLAAGRVNTTPRWSMVAAGGIGLDVRAGMEQSSILAGASCAPLGNFVAAEALIGVAKPIGRVSGRALAGPALYSGAEDTSIGVQARLDLNAPVSAHLGLGWMLRATLLPSHDGERLTLWAAGGTLTFR